MNRILSTLSRTDLVAVGSWACLVLFGLAAVYSCTVDYQAADRIVPSNVARGVFLGQLTWSILGGIALLTCLIVPFRYFESVAYLVYGVSIVLLVAVLLVGVEVGGGRRWLVFAGLSLQPSEIAKVAFVFALARYLAGRTGRGPLWLLVGTFFLVLPPFLLVSREPDLGTSLVFPAIALPMLFYAGVSVRLLFALASPFISAGIMFFSQQVLGGNVWPWVVFVIVLLAVLYLSRLYVLQSLMLMAANLVMGLAIPLVWDRLKGYQQARILSFLDPSESNRLGYGYQTYQSKVAIGSGGITGKGFLEGSQKGLAFLPERHTDFVFSVVGEELGLLGAMLVLGLFLILILRALGAARQCKRHFGSLLAVGVAAYFGFQVVVNISITLGLLPVTGLPLPLLSKGGSSMLVSCMMVGVMLNVSSRWSEV